MKLTDVLTKKNVEQFKKKGKAIGSMKIADSFTDDLTRAFQNLSEDLSNQVVAVQDSPKDYQETVRLSERLNQYLSYGNIASILGSEFRLSDFKRSGEEQWVDFVVADDSMLYSPLYEIVVRLDYLTGKATLDFGYRPEVRRPASKDNEYWRPGSHPTY